MIDLLRNIGIANEGGIRKRTWTRLRRSLKDVSDTTPADVQSPIYGAVSKRPIGLCFGFLLPIASVHAQDHSISIAPIPRIVNSSAALEKELRRLKTRINVDARDCIENAQGMGTVGNYRASYRQTVDTGRIVGLEIEAVKICDGIHTSIYRYGVAYEKRTGKPIDISRIYNVATRREGPIGIGGSQL